MTNELSLLLTLSQKFDFFLSLHDFYSYFSLGETFITFDQVKI